MERKYLIIMEIELNKDGIQEYLQEGWHIEEDYGIMVKLGLYVNGYDIFIENLKDDLKYGWDNEDLNYNNYDEFEEMQLKLLQEDKCLQYINGYSYYIEEE